jgi:hypothetical protein
MGMNVSLRSGMVGQGQLEPEGNKKGTRNAVKPTHALPNDGGAGGQPRSRQRPAYVDPQAIEVEQQAQQQKGQGLVLNARANELGHKGQKEQRHLGVEGIGPKASENTFFRATALLFSRGVAIENVAF